MTVGVNRRVALGRLPAVLGNACLPAGRCKTAKAHQNARLQTRVKSLDYVLFAKAYAKARAKGFDDALLVDAQGHIVETSRANIFMWRKGSLWTPPLTSGCLDGITRGQVIRRAHGRKVTVYQRDFTVKDLLESDGAFVTNALVGSMPLASIDGHAFKIPHIRLAL